MDAARSARNGRHSGVLGDLRPGCREGDPSPSVRMLRAPDPARSAWSTLGQGRARGLVSGLYRVSHQSTSEGQHSGSSWPSPATGAAKLSGRLPLHSAGAIPALPEIERVGSAALGGSGATLARLEAPNFPFPLHPRHISSGPRFQSVHQRPPALRIFRRCPRGLRDPNRPVLQG